MTTRERYNKFATTDRVNIDNEIERLMDFVDFEQALSDYEKSKWVSVDNIKPQTRIDPDFPHRSSPILIASNGFTFSGYYNEDDESFRDENDFYYEDATHWQPLPQSPEIPKP